MSLDFSGALLITDLAVVLHMSADTIARRLKAGTFPIPPLPLDVPRGAKRRRRAVARRHLRWAGPVVLRYLESNGEKVNGARARGTK